jgi:hypothetical protein
MLSEADLRFLAGRRRYVRTWKLAAAGMLAALAAVILWLALRVPTLVNPLVVAERLRTGAIDRAALETASLLLPVAVLGCLAITLVVVLLGFAVMANERRYLRIIDRLGSALGTPSPAGAQNARSGFD